MKGKYWKKRTAGPIEAIHPTSKKVIEVYPQRDALIPSDLNRALRRQAGLLAYWMQLRDEAKFVLREAKFAEHIMREDIGEEVRAGTAAKITEAAVKEAVNRDPRMRKAYRDRMDAMEMLQRLESAVTAIVERGWMLRSLAKDGHTERAAGRDSF